MFFTAATRPGNRDTVNEDWVTITPELLVVLDGATVRTETGCLHDAAWYAQELGAAIVNRAGWSVPLPVALDQAIADVAASHRPLCDLTHPGTPSAAVAVVRRQGLRLQWLVLGDVTVVVDTGDEVTVVSDQRISATALGARIEADRYPIGHPRKEAALVVMKHAELAARNTPDGYWIAAADPAAAEHALTGEVAFGDVRRVAVLTDGAARYCDLFRLGDWGDVLNTLGRCGPRWFIDRLIRPVEAVDPTGARYPRNKPSDDATAVFADFTEPPTPEPALPGERQEALTALTAVYDNPRIPGERIRTRA